MQRDKFFLIDTHLNTPLIGEIRQMIDSARQHVAATINSEITLLYWQIGQCIHNEILKGKRAEYGKQIFEVLSAHLTQAYGRDWGTRHLRDGLWIAQIVPDKKILHTVCAKLSWSHLRLIMVSDEPIKRDFYIEICCLEN